MVDYEGIGKRVTYYRKKARLTQQNLAEKLNLSVAYIGMIERGKAKPTLERLYQISEILKVDIVLLLASDFSSIENNIATQFYDIVKNWPREKISFLMHILMQTDEYFREHDKEKK